MSSEEIVVIGAGAAALYYMYKKGMLSSPPSNNSLTHIPNGYVAFADSTGQLMGDGDLFWDNVNKRLGIGNLNPSLPLVVSKQAEDCRVRIDTATAGNPILNMTTLGQQDWSIGVDRSDAGKLKISSAGNLSHPVLTITPGGDLFWFRNDTTVNFRVPRSTFGSGWDFSIEACGAPAGSTNQNGGDVTIKPGTATGYGSGAIMLYGVVLGPSGTLDSEAVVNAIVANGGMKIGKGAMGNPISPLEVVGLPAYTSNAAALSSGLPVGAFYRNGDIVCVVH